MIAPPAAALGPAAEDAKAYRAGTHRVCTPDETLARLAPLLGPVGITRVAPVTGLDTIGIPVVMVTRPNARSLAVAQGKGTSLVAAKVSGIMESLEAFHAETITAPVKLATFHELRFTHPMAALDELPRVAGTRFDPEQTILWIEASDLLGGGTSWLPYEVVHTRYTLPLPPHSGTFLMSSSGLGAGNCRGEAVAHALCELIERDAATLWRVAPPEAREARRIDLTTVDDPGCVALLDRYRAAGVGVMAWDLTSDLGVAAVRCEICDLEPDHGRALVPMGGFGCAPCREVALSRALTEAAQSRLTRIAGSREDIADARPADEVVAAARRFHARLAADGPRRRFAELPRHDHASVDADVAFLLGQLRGAGLEEVLAIDLTRVELGIPVVRVVVPGLEALSDFPGWSPGVRARRAAAAAAVTAP